ncbi:MAG: hypothetical protein IPL61_01235 [Myxococcales bacterium]|nr:hypothetical protein [Myxococcales bacterium]
MLLRSFLVAVLAVPLAACGLVDSNITNFDLALPEKTFTIDAGDWSLNNADQLVSTQCTVAPDPCAAAAAQACAMGACIAQCNATSLTCDLTLFVSLYTGVDLLTEKPELSTIQDEPVIDVTIDAITYRVTENSLNTDTPEMKVYAAPMTVTRAGDPLAREIGSVPPIPAGTTLTEAAVVLSPTGKATLAEFMGDFKTPFNIVVGSNLLVQQGDMVPAGRMVVSVAVKAHAGV